MDKFEGDLVNLQVPSEASAAERGIDLEHHREKSVGERRWLATLLVATLPARQRLEVSANVAQESLESPLLRYLSPIVGWPILFVRRPLWHDISDDLGCVAAVVASTNDPGCDDVLARLLAKGEIIALA
jgi:hypothetical protein